MFYRKKSLVDIDWEALITALPFSAYWKNKAGNYVNCNLSYAEFLGLGSIEEVIEKNDRVAITEKKDIFLFLKDDSGVLKYQKPIVFKNTDYYAVKMPLKNKKGDTVGVVGFLWDMLKNQNEVVRELHLLDEIIAVMPGHVYWKDRNCILQGCNELQAKDSGLISRKMIVGKTAYDLLLQDQPEHEKQEQAAITNSYDEEVMKLDKTMTFEEHVVQPDKSIATFLSKKTPLHDEYGNVMGLVGISFDITDIKKSEVALKIAKEQAEFASRAKTEFLENMRHDIRTPLTGIIGFAELIQKEAVSEKIKEYADDLVLATKALLDFQNEILEVIKVGESDDVISQKQFDLKVMIDKVIALLRPKAIVKNVALILELDSEISYQVVGDHKRLFRILLELITNAIKFTFHGEVRVVIRTENIGQQQFMLHCDIVDSGIGIPEDQYDSIFVRFHRLSSSATGLYEGTGLGLTLVKQFIETLSGKISVRSKITCGTTFSFFVPLKKAKISTDLDAITVPDEKFLFIESPAILLVEDHEMTAKVTRLLLLELGCSVDVAVDSEEALQFVQKKKFDLILMDLGLPDSNGFLLTEQIRKMIGDQLPIIALTAHKELDAHDRCLISGINTIFQKPLLKKSAIQLLKHYLKKDYFVKAVDLKLGAKRLNKTEMDARGMLSMLCEHIEKDKAVMTTALQKKDWHGLKNANHKLLGGLAYCGAPRLESACSDLQDALEKLDSELIHGKCTRVLQEIDLLKNSF